MKKSLISLIIILAVLLNITTAQVYAADISVKDTAPIYNVVVPTGYNITVDPYEIINKDSMISSPEYFIINKSSVPVKVDISFKLSSRNGSLLEIKSKRNMVKSVSYDNEIWFAVVFNEGVMKVIKEEKTLKNRDGDTVYEYEEVIDKTEIGKENVNIESGPEIQDKSQNENPNPNKKILPTYDIGKETGKVVSGTAITMENNVQGSSHDIVEPIAKVVSSSSITIENSMNNSAAGKQDIAGDTLSYAITKEADINNQSDETGEKISNVVSGTAIIVDNIIPEVDSGTESGAVVTGAAITTDENGNAKILNADVITGAVVSGAAIINKDNGNNQLEKADAKTGVAVSGAAITLKKDISSRSDFGNDKEAEPEKIHKIIKYTSGDTIPEGAKTVTYQDIVRVVGRYGNISELSEESQNVLVVDNSWSTKTFVLDKAQTYRLSDGTTVTGAAADNKGVAAFRFIGKVNTKVKWSETDLKATICYTIDGLSEEADDEGIIQNEKSDIVDNNVKTQDIYQYDEVKTGLNNSDIADNIEIYSEESNNEMAYNLQKKIE